MNGKWEKIVILVIICIIAPAAIWYHAKKVNEAELAKADAIIAQGGQLVIMHYSLSKDNPNYPQLSIMRTLAQEAQEKLRTNDHIIRKNLPPENAKAFQDMKEQLDDITKSANH